MNRKLTDFGCVVVKIGSSLLTNNQAELNREWLSSLAADIATLRKSGIDVVVVSSGAIALGRVRIRDFNQELSAGSLSLKESQAAAAIGQIALSSAYEQALGDHGLKTAQVLLTISDTEERRRYLNARATIGTLLKWGIVPIINENDTVATSEIRYGDNDRLAARVASMLESDLLVLLSDVEGLYSKPPQSNPDAVLLDEVPAITEEILAMAGDAASKFSRGGMKTKIDAAKLATQAGVTMVIASGRHQSALSRLNKSGTGTWFLPVDSKRNAKKNWIAGGLQSNGSITIDNGALLALESGKSLLPAGVVSVDGEFERGETIMIHGPNGHLVGRGLSEYSSADARNVVGLKSVEIIEVLGPNIRTEMVHRDNLAFEKTDS